MRLTGIDHRLELGVGQHRVDVRRQQRAIARPGRRDARHRRRLDQFGRMRLRAGNADRLQSVCLIDGISQTRTVRRRPVYGLIAQFHAVGICGDGCGGTRSGRAREVTAHGFRRGTRSRCIRFRQRHRQARRHLRLDPAEQGGDIGRGAGRCGKHGRIAGGHFFEDGDPRRERRGVPGIDRAVDRGGEYDTAALSQAGEGIPPVRCVWREVRPGDRHQPSAGSKAGQRRGDMAIAGVGHPAGDIRHCREWWVHQHHARDRRTIQMIVDLGGVEAGDVNGRKEGGEQVGAGLGQFVEQERTAGDFGEDREQAGAGRRLQHDVARRDAGGGDGGEAERGRRGKLLERLALLGAARMRRQETGDPGEGGKPCRRRRGFAEKRLSVFAQEQNGRRLAGVIGCLPVPGAGRIGSVEGRFHRGAQHGSVDALAAFEMGKQEIGGGKNGRRRAKRRGRIDRVEHHIHVGEPRESGDGTNPLALSLDRAGSTRSGPTSFSRRYPGHENSARPRGGAL